MNRVLNSLGPAVGVESLGWSGLGMGLGSTLTLEVPTIEGTRAPRALYGRCLEV